MCNIPRTVLLAHIRKTLYSMWSIKKGEFILNYKRCLYGKILLDEKLLMENNIYHDVEVEYYKVKRKDENNARNSNEVYGIEIVKRDYYNEEVKVENEYIEKVTSDEQSVNNILEKLKNNQVTPVELEYVIKDLLK